MDRSPIPGVSYVVWCPKSAELLFLWRVSSVGSPFLHIGRHLIRIPSVVSILGVLAVGAHEEARHGVPSGLYGVTSAYHCTLAGRLCDPRLSPVSETLLLGWVLDSLSALSNLHQAGFIRPEITPNAFLIGNRGIVFAGFMTCLTQPSHPQVMRIGDEERAYTQLVRGTGRDARPPADCADPRQAAVSQLAMCWLSILPCCFRVTNVLQQLRSLLQAASARNGLSLSELSLAVAHLFEG